MQIELTRFKIKEGKLDRVKEWMNLLKNNLPLVLETFTDEKMYVEAIFSDSEGGSNYLYWFSIQGEGGTAVQTSEYEIDKKHLKYFEECIEKDSKKDLDLEMFLHHDQVKFGEI